MANPNPNVSVIIPTYNRANYITKAVESVLSQRYNDYEIIVVDDGSTDNTKEVLKAYRKGIQYIYQKNAGVSLARNAGILAARGKWTAFLDSDDEWVPEKLWIQMTELSDNDKLCLHTTNHSINLENGEKASYFEVIGLPRAERERSIIGRPLKYQIKYGVARIQCAIIRREALMDAGLFDARLSIYEDQDLMCRLALEGSWVVSELELVKCFRRKEEIINLAKQRILEPVESLGGLIYLYGKLIRNNKLSQEERRLVINKLSSCRAALGMELIKQKKKSDARHVLQESFIQRPSLKSAVRYFLSFLPSSVAAWVGFIWHRIRKCLKFDSLKAKYSD